MLGEIRTIVYHRNEDDAIASPRHIRCPLRLPDMLYDRLPRTSETSSFQFAKRVTSTPISVIYGTETPQLYDDLTKQLVLLGEWLQLMSIGIEIQTPYNTGYKQKMLMVRYYPTQVRMRNVPLYLPQATGQMAMYAPDAVQHNYWRFGKQDSIRALLAQSHVTSFNEFFYGIFYLYETIDNLVTKLKQAKHEGVATTNAFLENIVTAADSRVDAKRAFIRTAVAFFQCVQDDLLATSGAHSVVIPMGVDASDVDLSPLTFRVVVKKLQTSFIEQAMQYYAGARLALPLNDRTYFTYTVDGIQHTLTDMSAIRGRFDRRARKYWSPFSRHHGPRGIEVGNIDGLFMAPELQTLRQSSGLNTFEAEMAARALFESVHTFYDPYQYADTSSVGEDTIWLSPAQDSELTIRSDGSGSALPLNINLIDVLNANVDERPFGIVFKRLARLGQTTFGLFPSKYSDEAITLYNTMQRAAASRPALIKRRYSGLLYQDPEVFMRWLDSEFNPSSSEGTLAGALQDYEDEFDPYQADDAQESTEPADMQM